MPKCRGSRLAGRGRSRVRVRVRVSVAGKNKPLKFNKKIKINSKKKISEPRGEKLDNIFLKNLLSSWNSA